MATIRSDGRWQSRDSPFRLSRQYCDKADTVVVAVTTQFGKYVKTAPAGGSAINNAMFA